MTDGATTEPYGPNSNLVLDLIDRATHLTEAQGLRLLEANRAMVVGRRELSHALRDVVYAAHHTGRISAMERAERAARGAVHVFGGSRRCHAVAGVVGRTAETLVVADEVTRETLEFLLAPWRSMVSAGA